MEFCISCGTPTKKGFHVCDKCMFGMGKNVPKIKLEVSVDKTLYKQFCDAIKNHNVKEEVAFDTAMKLFIDHIGKNIEKDVFAETKHRIKQWAKKPNTNAHKIIKAYFASKHLYNCGILIEMEKFCTDKSKIQFYVGDSKKFYNNYNNMKSLKPAVAKIFKAETPFGRIQFWYEIKNTLMEYKKFFFDEIKDLPK